MAAHYLSEIRTVQPTGPYFLGGYCFGGKVALEMAQQLHDQGEQVALLAMIDAYAPGYLTLLPWIERKVKQRFAYHWGNLSRLSSHERLNYILEKTNIVRVRIATRIKEIIVRLFLILEIPLPAALQQVNRPKRLPSNYVPKTYPHKITVFSPTEGPNGFYHEPDMGWGKYTAEELEIHEVPGSFSKIILEPAVKSLAEQLKTCIERATVNGR
jgi:thioesterase domain-containing protein